MKKIVVFKLIIIFSIAESFTLRNDSIPISSIPQPTTQSSTLPPLLPTPLPSQGKNDSTINGTENPIELYFIENNEEPTIIDLLFATTSDILTPQKNDNESTQQAKGKGTEMKNENFVTKGILNRIKKDTEANNLRQADDYLIKFTPHNHNHQHQNKNNNNNKHRATNELNYHNNKKERKQHSELPLQFTDQPTEFNIFYSDYYLPHPQFQPSINDLLYPDPRNLWSLQNSLFPSFASLSRSEWSRKQMNNRKRQSTFDSITRRDDDILKCKRHHETEGEDQILTNNIKTKIRDNNIDKKQMEFVQKQKINSITNDTVPTDPNRKPKDDDDDDEQEFDQIVEIDPNVLKETKKNFTAIVM